MKAAVKKNNTLEIKEIEAPTLKEKGAIIKVFGTGLCGSDIVKHTQNFSKEGAVLGHEVVGEIVEINSETNFKIGEKIALGHHVPCFECVYCKNENFSMCAKFKSTNIIPGGFSEYIYITEDHLKNTIVKIPQHVTFEQASFTEPLACCLRAVKRADIKESDRVLIIGLGSIGLLLGQVAKHFKAEVYGADIIKERQRLALSKGFDSLYNEEKEYFDKIFLAAGADKTVDLAVKSTRNGGEIIVFASVKNQETAFSNNDIYYRELTIKGSYSPSCKDLHESMRLISQGIIDVDNFSTTYNLEDINTAIEDHIKNKILKAFIKI